MTPQIAIEILKRYKRHCFGDGRHDGGVVSVEQIIDMLTAQPEITDEQAIDHLEATGWLKEHDRQMYEMGIKEQLADDSGSYDSLIPQDCIYRQNAIDVIDRQDAIDAVDQIIARDASGNNDVVNALTAWKICITGLPPVQLEPCEDAVSRADVVDMLEMFPFVEYSEYETAREVVERLPSVTLPSTQPERRKGRWILGICGECGYDWSKDAPISSVPNFCPNCGADMRGEQDEYSN